MSAQLVGTNYMLGDVLGVGGMGVVYAAVQRSLERTVAVKLPRPELASDQEIRDHFRVEALVGSRVNHPNVVRVLDFGTHDRRPFLVMDHIAGPLLGELLLERGRMTVAAATALVHQLLAGLGEAHACGIVHADVKCDNILVETMRDGTAVPRLIDFGIACCDGDAPRTTALEVSGTPEYLAPELIRGGPPSFASDVYAAGVILYELVTGATPFAGGTSQQIMERALADAPMPMSWRCPDREISSELDALVDQALAKEPSVRFANAAAFGHALASAIDRAHAPHCAGLSTKAAAPRIEQERQILATAMLGSDGDAIAVAYLGIVRALVDAHHLAEAIAELEQAIELLEASTDEARRTPIWRLLLTLAALYDGRGDRAMARQTTRDAHTHAVRAQSKLGRERAEQLWERLAQGTRAW